jgi:flagellar motor switch protein FliG
MLQSRTSTFDSASSSFDFADLKWIGLNQLASVLQNCEPRAMLVALSTADAELLNRISLLFSKSDWKRLKDRLRSLGRIDQEDVHTARMIVAETAGSLLNEKDSQRFSERPRHGFARAA